MITLTVEVAGLTPRDRLLAPVGTTTPHEAVANATVEGGRILEALREPELGLAALLVDAEGGPLRLRHRIVPAPADAAYPEAAFAPRRNRFTAAAEPLAAASRAIAAAAGGGDAGIAALVAEAEARFAYAHPEVRFNDGCETVPHLACGVTPGSCVDINTYLVASLRAAGYEAGYLYGYFFPAERGGVTHDMHCWVVTRHAGEVLEWDVAHHMKAGLGPTRPGLNPRPGRRVALGHSMGHRYALGDAGPALLKLLSEPVRLVGRDEPQRLPLSIRLDRPDAGRRDAPAEPVAAAVR